jgi:hypothetical protein
MRTLLVTLTMCLLAVPANAKYSGGTGEPNDPYQIATAADLIALGETPADYDKHFILTADIDLDPNLPGCRVFDRAVIAPAESLDTWGYVGGTAFTGVFDGNGHVISHLTITGRAHLGLFGYMMADVKSLRLEKVNIAGSDGYIGGLAGLNGGAVTQCCSAGVVNGNDDVGGLVGFNAGGGSVTQCYSSGVVSGTGDSVGGLVGENDKGDVRRCYSIASVVGNRHVGGLVGLNEAHCNLTCWAGEIVQCYSAGGVRGNSSVGGLVGYDIGGFVRRCFWDIQTSGQASSAGGAGKTTAEMRDPNTFIAADWDFAPHDIWFEPEGGGSPILWWQLSPWPALPTFSGGVGEPNDPYVISTTEELNSIGHNPKLMACHFRLAKDLDYAGLHFFAIGSPDYPYRGVFEGVGHTISHLTMEGDAYLGVFGATASGAQVRNLGVIEIEVSGSGNYIGGLVAQSGGRVNQCWSTGSANGLNNVGGLVGKNLKTGEVVGCYSASQVNGDGATGRGGGEAAGVGGLVGTSLGSVTECYTTGTVHGSRLVGGLIGTSLGSVTECYTTGTVHGGQLVGGLIGHNSATVTKCYSTGRVTGLGSVGGLIGTNRGDMTFCYSTGTVSGSEYVGGLVGCQDYMYSDRGTATGCFWDVETSGQTESAGGTGKTTAEMQTAKTFLDAGWDFVGETANGTEDIWKIAEGLDYPRLWWETGN